MGQCRRCGKKRWLLAFPRRLDVPELRAMVSHWPWHRVEVCPSCAGAFQDEFRRRVALLAADALAQEGDVSERVCLLCGEQSAEAGYVPSARWVNPQGTPAGGRFFVCGACQGRLTANNVVSAAELGGVDDFRKLLVALSEASDDVVRSDEGWSLAGGAGPAGAKEVLRHLAAEDASRRCAEFWGRPPEGLGGAGAVRGAMMLPEKPGSIRTHLELRWKAGGGGAKAAVALGVYRVGEGYVVVRF